MPHDLREAVTIENRRLAVADHYLAGATQTEIAAQLGVDQATISRDVRALRQQWREKAVRDIEQKEERELAILDRIEDEAWAGWKRSCRKSKRVTRTANGAVLTTTKTQCGNPRFLFAVLTCIGHRCKIFGLYATEPVKPIEPPPKILTRDEMIAKVRAFLAKVDGGTPQPPTTIERQEPTAGPAV